MILRFISDLHLEFYENIDKFLSKFASPIDNEVCILAGDIGNPFKENYDIFMKFISKTFVKTFVITGNHEYYNSSIQKTNTYLEEYFKQFDNISFLNNKCEFYEGYWFIGTTLWSKITNNEYKINDIDYISDFNCEKYNKLNEECIKFLNDNIKENSIIITHHVPSYDLIDRHYKRYMFNYNEWFYCDMNKFIKDNKEKIKAWVYGHTHIQSVKTIENILFLCNPIGYPTENPDATLNSSIII
jgi:predicted phosphohydrolase